MSSKQLEAWSGEFGDQYIERNRMTEELLLMRTRAWATMLEPLAADLPKKILEVGCNIGGNQRALKRLLVAEHFAVEPNARAREVVVQDGVMPADHVKAGDASAIPFADGTFDLVFTSGVLIHIAPEDLDQAYREICRTSGKYILCCEYFSQKPETISYREQEGLLFKRDFGGHWLDLYPSIEPIAYGFFWKRVTGGDDSTWWLFRKPRP